MAIKTDTALMDIYSAVRKGSVQFDSDDYVPVNLNKDNKSITLFIGGVHYDYTAFDACYDLYTKDGILINSSQPLSIQKLPPHEVKCLAEKLKQYDEYACARYKSYGVIDRMLNDSPDGCIKFERESEMPRFPLGEFTEGRVTSVFKDKNGVFMVSVLGEDKTLRNINLVLINDKTLLNIASCIKVMKKNMTNEKAAVQKSVNYFHL